MAVPIDPTITEVKTGVILINPETEHIFVVKDQSYRWGFPRGLHRQDELMTTSAAKHLYDQTGITMDLRGDIRTGASPILAVLPEVEQCYMTQKQMLYFVDDATKMGVFNYPTSTEPAKTITLYYLSPSRMNRTAKMDESKLVAMQWIPLSQAVQIFAGTTKAPIINSIVQKLAEAKAR